ncbi:MAG: ribonuclease HII [Oscillospiraceae bacterium]|nr:ribonuclease HII [Ruminococcus sp.]MCD8345710.1 ribonuclease HII [Oscillospiraceae bacterium]
MTLFEFDRQFDSEANLIVGIDEAGRGPLAGDVYAAAVVFDRETVIGGINDSKKLSPKKREALFDVIKDKALSYSIATATVEEIEELNILEAAMLAMRRAYDGLGIDPDKAVALIDGNRSPKLPCRCQTIIHGDALSQSIAAASVLAKVQRDRYMVELSEKYPEYQFEKHKGYGTKLHYEMIKKYGISEVHRRSFLKNLSEK